MRQWIAVLLFMACVTANASPIHEQARKSTLFLQFTDGGCSGTAVGKNVILSATHCFVEGPLVSINGIPAKVLHIVNDGNDHALVGVDITFTDIAKYGKAAKPGDSVFIIGNPRVLRGVLRIGYIAKVEPEQTLLDIQGFFGDSGAAIFNSKGEIVGVISAIIGEPGFTLMVSYPMAFAS